MASRFGHGTSMGVYRPTYVIHVAEHTPPEGMAIEAASRKAAVRRALKQVLSPDRDTHEGAVTLAYITQKGNPHKVEYHYTAHRTPAPQFMAERGYPSKFAWRIVRAGPMRYHGALAHLNTAADEEDYESQEELSHDD